MKRIIVLISIIIIINVFSGSSQNVIQTVGCIPEPNIFHTKFCHEKKVIPAYNFYICDANPWTLIFEDNFDGYVLDEYKWFRKYAVPRDADFELTKSLFLFENVVVEDGKLKIFGKRENVDNFYLTTKYDENGVGIEGKYVDFDYTAGEIESQAEFFYGRFEARLKLPSGKGLYPAFWTFGAPWSEIDIFEFSNVKKCDLLGGNYDPDLNQKVIQTNIHTEYGSYGHLQCGKSVGIKMPNDNDYVDFSKEFHVFAADFEKQYIKWYVDGIL
jgi:sialidase-1